MIDIEKSIKDSFIKLERNYNTRKRKFAISISKFPNGEYSYELAIKDGEERYYSPYHRVSSKNCDTKEIYSNMSKFVKEIE